MALGKGLLLVCAWLSLPLFAESIQSVELPKQSPQTFQQATSTYLNKETDSLNEDWQWKQDRLLSDPQFHHTRYSMWKDGRKLDGSFLQLHYNREGWIEYAQKNQPTFSYEEAPVPLDEIYGSVVETYEEKMKAFYRTNQVRVEATPVWWQKGEGDPLIPAWEVVTLTHAPFSVRHFFVDEDLKILEERNPYRFAKVYKISPYNGGANNGATTDLTLPGLLQADKLWSNYIRVQREQSASQLLDVDPSVDYTMVAGFTTDPTTYNPSCATPGSPQCPNQQFDAVNVYYHLESFREYINSVFTALNATPPMNADPFYAFVNVQSVDFNGDGSGTDEGNNAAFVPFPCTSDGTVRKCLIFLKPLGFGGTLCGTGNKGWHVTREGLVMVHEYQHYVTDSLTGMLSGSTKYNVGDALHEGYSDYFAVSFLSTTNATAVTKVGEFAFQECTPILRDLATLRPYQNSTADADPHTSGLTWASGLYQLRAELGATVVDKMALQSQYFLSPRPGFIDAVEALVRADKALNQGQNVHRIRQLFYQTLGFIGGKPGVFMDGAYGVVDMGVKGCASANTPSHPLQGIAIWILWIAFLSVWYLVRSPKILKNIKSIWILPLCFFAGNTYGDGAPPVFIRACPVFSKATPKSSLACKGRIGDTAFILDPMATGYVKVKTPQCIGYVPNECIKISDYDPIKRAPKSESVASANRIRVHVGGLGMYSMNRGDVASSGLGYGAEAQITIPFTKRYRVSIGSSYQRMNLGREIAIGSDGALEDTSTQKYSQRFGLFSGNSFFGLNMSDLLKVHVLESGEVTYFWAELGAEYAKTISSSQVNYYGEETTFSMDRRFFFLLLGFSAEVPLNRRIGLTGNFRAQYQLGTTGGSILGVRAGLAFHVTL